LSPDQVKAMSICGKPDDRLAKQAATSLERQGISDDEILEFIIHDWGRKITAVKTDGTQVRI
jgi:hypothetical protein